MIRYYLRRLLFWVCPELRHVKRLELESASLTRVASSQAEYMGEVMRLALQNRGRIELIERAPTDKGLGARVALLELRIAQPVSDAPAYESALDAAWIAALCGQGEGEKQ